MRAAWQDALRSAWKELAQHPAQSRQFRTRRLSPTLALNVYAGLRAPDDAPCLLIDADVPAASLFEVGGMRLNTYTGDFGPLLGLTLEDAGRADLFAMVCGDAIAAASDAPAEESLPDSSRGWMRGGASCERRAGLTRNETVGLLGELLILERLLGADPSLLPSWAAPDDGLHDFVHLGHALEIKTSLGPSSTMRISTLDQLDATGLRRLDLLHVRLVETPQGQCLGTIVDNVATALPDEPSRRTFANALLRRGLMPDDLPARSAPVVELRDVTVYSVDPSFPRLVRSNVPSAVRDAEYLLDLRSIARHAVDTDSAVNAFAGGRTP